MSKANKTEAAVATKIDEVAEVATTGLDKIKETANSAEEMALVSRFRSIR